MLQVLTGAALLLLPVLILKLLDQFFLLFIQLKNGMTLLHENAYTLLLDPSTFPRGATHKSATLVLLYLLS